MAGKRKFEFDVAEVESAHENVIIHGILLPKITSRRDNIEHLNVAIGDGKKTMQMVSFDLFLKC